MYASAKGLGRLAAVMANKGTFKGKTVLSDSAWEDMHSYPEVQLEGVMGQRSIFTRGGLHFFKKSMLKGDLNNFEKSLYYNNDGFYGWKGYGGSSMQWHPELKIGFAYVPTDLCRHDYHNYRS